MKWDQINDTKPGDRLSSAHVNQLNQAARLVANSGIGSDLTKGPYNVSAGTRNWKQFIVEVIGSVTDASENNAYLYQCYRLFYNGETDIWEQSKDIWILDTKAFEIELSSGQRCVAYWDRHRRRHIPIVDDFSGGGGIVFVQITGRPDEDKPWVYSGKIWEHSGETDSWVQTGSTIHVYTNLHNIIPRDTLLSTNNDEVGLTFIKDDIVPCTKKSGLYVADDDSDQSDSTEDPWIGVDTYVPLYGRRMFEISDSFRSLTNQASGFGKYLDSGTNPFRTSDVARAYWVSFEDANSLNPVVHENIQFDVQISIQNGYIRSRKDRGDEYALRGSRGFCFYFIDYFYQHVQSIEYCVDRIIVKTTDNFSELDYQVDIDEDTIKAIRPLVASDYELWPTEDDFSVDWDSDTVPFRPKKVTNYFGLRSDTAKYIICEYMPYLINSSQSSPWVIMHCNCPDDYCVPDDGA